MAEINQIKLLVSLSQVDGKVADPEKSYIRNIGLANGFSDEDVEMLMEQRHQLIVPDNLTDEQKFNYIFSLVQLMKIDERVYKEEILFCSRIAATLGYSEEVMFDLMLHVRSAAMSRDEVEALRELTRKYLN